MVTSDLSQGTLYGLGVGPGDPELITMKAARVMAVCPVIAYPTAEGEESLARKIAAPHIPDGLIEIPIETPMIPGRYPAHEVYDRYAAIIADHLRAGRDVAVLCEGDPLFFGSFMYLYDRMKDHFRTEVIPGVSSLGACAAAAGLPLVSRLDVMTIVPGPLDNDAMTVHLKTTNSAVIMKVGRHLQRLRGLLDQLGLIDQAWLVERASMAEQRVIALADCEDETAPYFSMILVSAHGQ